MHYNIPCRILQLVLFIHIICAVGIWCLSLPTSTINSDTPTTMIDDIYHKRRDDDNLTLFLHWRNTFLYHPHIIINSATPTAMIHITNAEVVIILYRFYIIGIISYYHHHIIINSTQLPFGTFPKIHPIW